MHGMWSPCLWASLLLKSLLGGRGADSSASRQAFFCVPEPMEVTVRFCAKLEDGSLVDQDGRIRFVTHKRLVEKILPGENCFICGASRDEKEFNDEHVVPDWILRRYDLYDEQITLPNKTRIRYRQYVVPCCSECNSEMGRQLEEPASQILSGGLQEANEYVRENGPWLLISWMALIYFKTHYKDAFLRWHRDQRLGDHKIGGVYDWRDFHHIYCLARAFYSHSGFDKTALTTFLMLPSIGAPGTSGFDYTDLYDSQSAMLQLGNMAIIAFFADGCAAMHLQRERLEAIRGPLAPIQLRELYARMSFHSMLVTNRPEYRTQFDVARGKQWIEGKAPETINTMEGSDQAFGQLMLGLSEDLLNSLPEKTREESMRRILTGRASYLQDESGQFIQFPSGDSSLPPVAAA